MSPTRYSRSEGVAVGVWAGDEPPGVVSGPPARRVAGRTSEVACGRCRRPVPSGRAVIVVHWRGVGLHQLFCPEHVPDGTRPWRGDQ